MFNTTSYSYELLVESVDAWVNATSSVREAPRAA